MGPAEAGHYVRTGPAEAGHYVRTGSAKSAAQAALHPIGPFARIDTVDMLTAVRRERSAVGGAMKHLPAAMSVEQDETLAKAKGGDTSAFDVLVRRHQSMVFSLALHALRNRAAAEDLAQDVFLRLYRDIGCLESTPHVISWLRRVTSHRCIDELRRRRYQRELAMDAVPERSVAPSTREMILEDRIQRLVASLPPRARMVVVLRYQEDLDPAEIADALQMPVNTVKSHLRRSLAVLRARLLKDRSR
jgi:RNA polymerase sigma-70 factor, ECF subfamily